jgi:bla regulator protein blaR1
MRASSPGLRPALVKAAWGRTPAAACGLNGTEQLKQRLRMMRIAPRGFVRHASGAALAVVLVGAGLAVTASSGMAAQVVRATCRHVAAIPAVAAIAAIPPVPPVPPIAEGAMLPPHAAPPMPPAMPPMPIPAIAMVAPPAPPVPAAPTRLASADDDDDAVSVDVDVDTDPDPGLGARIERQVQVSLASARNRMAASCVKQGKPVATDDDWDALALCGGDKQEIRRQVINGLREARDEIAREKEMPDRVRRHVLASLDREIRHQEK